jgi:allantoinase
MDHDHYAWSPIATRAPLIWPGDARVALCVIVNLEHMEWRAPQGSFQPPGLYSHLAMQRPLAEFWTVSHREYGHRVGIFRILDVLRRHGIPATVALDAMTARHYPYLVKHCLAAGCEMIAHGVAVTRMITSRMSESEERAYIREAVDAVATATGCAPRGWHGPEYGQSARTPQLLAEAGIRYVCDWANDEQPYRLNAAQPLFALPIMLELDDVFALRDRRFRVDEYTVQITEAFDTIYREAATTGKTLVLNLHPWLTGQAFRIGFLERALAHVVGHPGVWKATGAQIIEAYQTQ